MASSSISSRIIQERASFLVDYGLPWDFPWIESRGLWCRFIGDEVHNEDRALTIPFVLQKPHSNVISRACRRQV
jgi:hypothetical protein